MDGQLNAERTISGTSRSGPNMSGVMNRAEKFEDEKRRIIESCFSKVDPDGALQESYITHIRITEDSAHQSSPPPPDANPDQKKPRLIIVAVRKSGRVRMHKARENANGTFSIGKTWPLDDLSAIESFTGKIPRDSKEEQYRQWSGDVGFIVTIGKPYYWQANTQKEKQFFIGSLVKIYTKYTGGRLPDLTGFDDKERDQVLGGNQAPQSSQPPNRPAQPLPYSPVSNASFGSNGRLPQPRVTNEPREPLSRPGTGSSSQAAFRPRVGLDQPSKSHVITSPYNDTGSSAGTSSTSLPRHDSEKYPHSYGQRQNVPLSQRNPTGDNRSQEPFAGREGGGSVPPGARNGANGLSSATVRYPERNVTPLSERARTPDSVGGSRREIVGEIPPVPAQLSIPPERKRPPLQISPERVPSRGQPAHDMVPAPLVTPSQRSEFMRPPARSSERPEPTQPLRVKTDSNNIARNSPEKASEAPPEELQYPPGIASNQTQVLQKDLGEPTDVSQLAGLAQEIPMSTETSVDERPGLGPMIKKKSKADVASAFRKAASAATAANAFKPRAGGAAERLREQQAKASEGPDGITGVVPAPSLLRGTSNAGPRPAESEQVVQQKPNISLQKSEPIPEVELTAESSSGSDARRKSTKADDEPPRVKESQGAIRRQKPASETMEKELTTLGIEPRLLETSGGEFVSLLDEFGWTDEGIHTKSIDQINERIDRELNKAQIGGWANRLDEEDGMVEVIKRGLDVTIAECEELEGLLTLYGVELSTLNEDIAYIEAQSHELQVQAANEKLLQAELKSLLDTRSISSS